MCKKHWNIDPIFETAKAGFENGLSGTTAGVIIGDRTFNLPKYFEYKFDLAEEWEKMTTLPFVFAAWVSTKELSKEFTELFNCALQNGIENISAAVEQDKSSILSKAEKMDYLNEKISYPLNNKKMKALRLFHSYLNDLG